MRPFESIDPSGFISVSEWPHPLGSAALRNVLVLRGRGLGGKDMNHRALVFPQVMIMGRRPTTPTTATAS